MKKIFFILIGLIILVGSLFMLTNDKEEELRVRILSNGNTELDLYEKQIVKDALEDALNEVDEINVYTIKKKLSELTKGKINNNINVEIKTSYYPAKSYEDKFIPSGNYETLLVTIGEGKGSNFWTLLYPEYYDIEFEESNEIEYRFYIVDLFKKLSNFLEN